MVFELCVSSAQATFVQWNIDQTQSKVILDIPDQQVTIDGTTVTMKVRNQTGSSANPWSVGNTAFFDGLLNTNYSEGVTHTIEFLANPVGQVPGLNSGNYRPNPAVYDPSMTDAANPDGKFTNTTTSGAVFGAKLQGTYIGLTFDLGFLSFYNTSLDLTSSPLAVTGTTAGTFDAIGAAFGLAHSDFAIDGVTAPIVGQKIPDTITTVDNIQGAASAATASITNLGGLNRRLSLTMTVPGTFDFEGTILNMSLTTTIVADGVALFPGDIDMSGTVDFADLGLLLNHYNQPGGFAEGDFDNTGTVDFADLGILLNNYNQSAPTAASAAPVPEPTTAWLVAIAAAITGFFRSRSRRLA